MANIKKLKENGQDIVPITHEQAVLDSNGVTLDSKLNAINNAISRLENNSTSNVPSLEGNALTFGNYTIKYNETDDTLDFIYNGVIDEPVVPPTTDEEIIPLTWVLGNLSGTDGSETEQDGTLRSGFVSIEDNYDYSFYLDTSLGNPGGIRVYFYDTNKTFISRTDGDVLGYTTGTDIAIDIPSNAAYMRFKSNVDGTTTLDNISTLLTLRKTISYGEVVSVTWIDGKTISSGNIVDNEIAMLSDPITIDNNYNYTIRYNPTTTNEVRIVFYDSSQTFISKSNFLTSGNVDTVITFPQNTAYFRIKAEKVGITVNEANDNIIIKKVKKTNGYVTDGLSMYIDANDVATYGSVRDITENHTITNHGVSTTSDNKYLNFVSTESDYLGTDFVPNLTQWSAEVYFQYTKISTVSQAIFSWGVASDNNIRLAYSSSTRALTLQSNAGTNYPILSDSNEIVKPHHLIITKDNGTVITYLDGVKSVLVTNAAVQSPHNGTLNIGARYSPEKYFADMHLKSFRFYDGKVLTDEEALQNYNYETNRNENIIQVTWIDNKNINYQGFEYDETSAMVTDYLTKENGYNYTINLTDVSSFKIYFYDSAKTFISRTDNLTVDSTDTLIEFPENTSYFRLKSDKGTATVNNANDYIILKKVTK